MKKYNIIPLVFLFLLSLGISSCEKGIDMVEYPSTIYFPQSGLSDVNLLWGESTYELAVYRAGINQSNKSFDVTVVYDQAGGEEFINDSTNYEVLIVAGDTVPFQDYPDSLKYRLLPAEYYTLPGEKVHIDSNSERAFFILSFNNVTDALRGAKYVLPLKIESVSPDAKILMEKSFVALHLNYRNVYGGPYRVIGKASSPNDSTNLKIDDVYQAKSIGENTIRIPGPIRDKNDVEMLVDVTINNGAVTVAAAEGFEHYNVQTVDCSYNGEFNEKYQRNKGDFKLIYTYEVEKMVKQEDNTMQPEIWVYTVDEVLKFWL